MILFIVSLLVSLFSAFAIIRTADRVGGLSRLSGDHDLSGPQKFHARPVPRIGGVGVFVAMLAGGVGATFLAHAGDVQSLWLLLAASLPTFVFGLAEDLTKGISPRRRLFFTAVSAALCIWLLDGVIARTAIPGIDQLVSSRPVAIALTIFVVTGVANSVNIIDGFNGLASMCVLIMMLALAYVAFQAGDSLVLTVGLITIGAVLGFFVFNFPAGLIFLGDGGAYLLGFLLAELNVLLLHRNPSVSPMFPLLLCAYPIFETIFTIYRRKFVRGTATAAPDGIHLHTLIHRRLVRAMSGLSSEGRQTARNSMTSPYLWLLCLLSVLPAVLWWDNTAVLTLFLILFMVSYTVLYRSIVHFKTPKWLIFRR